MYADVHTHLTHSRFADDWRAVIARAVDASVSAMVVNGLEPDSNRKILAMAQEFACIKPALGIYPLDAINHLLPDTLPFRVSRFNVKDEVEFIRSMAASGRLAAVGECGLDGHWVGSETFAAQELVFEQLIEISMQHHLPIIIHTRKCEQRASEILRHNGATRVNFHCFGGKSKWAQQWAEQDGWWFSIPANARNSESFTKMLRSLPAEKILTETDAPYLAPTRGERSEPCMVVQTIAYLAELRGWDVERSRQQVWTNYLSLFTDKV